MSPAAFGPSPASDGEQSMTRPSSGTASADVPGGPAGWHGLLELRFDVGPSGTRLVRNRHEGPLRLLKALRSEDGRRMEAVVVHPPGGLVGGDSLSIDLQVGPGARVLGTTPGAQKWYQGETTATSCTRLAVGAQAILEWLPQPALLFDRARARQTLAIELDVGACCVGWEILVRGRRAMGEGFDSGHIDQTLSISRAGEPLWRERLHAGAEDRIFDSPLGWDRRRIAASVWCCAPEADPHSLLAVRDRWRVLIDAAGTAGQDRPEAGVGRAWPAAFSLRAGATMPADGLVLAKVLADDSEDLVSLCRQLWEAARTSLEGSAGSAPRIWRT
jgi:urease accessory protein